MNTFLRTVRRSFLTVLVAIAALVTINLGADEAVQLYGASGSPGTPALYRVSGPAVHICPAGTA